MVPDCQVGLADVCGLADRAHTAMAGARHGGVNAIGLPEPVGGAALWSFFGDASWFTLGTRRDSEPSLA